jgi:hypothetical protein
MISPGSGSTFDIKIDIIIIFGILYEIIFYLKWKTTNILSKFIFLFSLLL